MSWACQILPMQSIIQEPNFVSRDHDSERLLLWDTMYLYGSAPDYLNSHVISPPSFRRPVGHVGEDFR